MSTHLVRPALRTLSSRLPRPVASITTCHHLINPTTSTSYSAHTTPTQTAPYSTTHSSRSNSKNDPPPSFFGSGPAPPRLPEAEQKIFESLQRQSTGAFSTPTANEAEEAAATEAAAEEAEQEASIALPEVRAQVRAQGDGDELHPDVRRGAGPEFEGERNPKTGEVGGPKNNPLRWGGEADWSFNGRVTDF